MCTSLKEGLLSTAEEVLWRGRKKIQPWAINMVLDLCDQRRQLKQQEYTSTEAGLECRKVTREVRKKMKSANEEWIEEQGQEHTKGNDVRKLHGGLKHTQGSHQDPTA